MRNGDEEKQKMNKAEQETEKAEFGFALIEILKKERKK